MQQNTQRILHALSTSRWFSSVGKGNELDAVSVNSWNDAIKSCSSLKWENLQLEASNQLRVQLLKHSKDVLNQWNSIVESLKAETRPLVQQKIAETTEPHNSDIFRRSVEWDVLGIALEAEFAHIASPGFNTHLLEWYLLGHFPCGWQGNYPHGKLIVY